MPVLNSSDFEQFEQQLIRWIAEWSRRPPEELDPSTNITGGWGGLGVDGADARELILFIQEKSGINMADFPFHKYFGPEASIAALLVKPWLIKHMFHNEKLTIRMLAEYLFERRSKR